MTKLIVSADIHGSLNAWLTIRALAGGSDELAIAGDLFDTRYGSYSRPDFKPEAIRSDLKTLPQPLYYVYGNCDIPSFSPGFGPDMRFSFLHKKIYLHHGHRPLPDQVVSDIVIQGHTHLCYLEKKDGIIYFNPGSIASPRNGLATYGVIDSKGIYLMVLKTGEVLSSITF